MIGNEWTNDRPHIWQDDALCATTDPELFFPDKGGSILQARKICDQCDVRLQCLEFALLNEHFHGVYGGLSPKQRRSMNKRVERDPRIYTQIVEMKAQGLTDDQIGSSLGFSARHIGRMRRQAVA